MFISLKFYVKLTIIIYILRFSIQTLKFLRDMLLKCRFYNKNFETHHHC